MDSCIAIVYIDYDEGDPSTYRGVAVKNDGLEVRRWNTDCPTSDYAEASLYAYENYSIVMAASSVDHFVMDGGDINTDW
jgi:hypothetical protein